MKKQNLLYLVCTLLFFSLNAMADLTPVNKIKGNIIESGTDLPLPYVTITLNDKVDSSLISGTFSDEDGSFEFRKISDGNYYLKLSMVGFQSHYIDEVSLSSDNKNIIIENIIMKPASQLLEQIEITGKMSPLSSTIEKQVIDASQNINAAGGTAVDLLRGSASIEIDSDENVKLRGSENFIVLIDGQPTVLSPADVLRQTPVGQISKIEIITNPPVKYSAEGGAGVINIIRKKGIPNSLNGLINLSAGNGDKYSGNTQVNWNSGKFSLSTGIDYQDNTIRSKHNYEKERLEMDTMYFSNMLQDRKMNFNNFGIRLGVNYDPNESHNFHYSLHTGINKFHLDIMANTGGYSEPETDHKYFYNTFEIYQNPVFVTNNLGFSKKINEKGMNLSGDVYYSFIDYYFQTKQETSQADSNYEPWDETPYLQNVINDNYSNDLRLNFDLSIPVNKNFQIETGLSLHDYLRYLNVTYSIFDYDLNDWWNDPMYTNVYDFNEMVYGAYTSVKTNLSGISVSAGLRAEYMDRDLRQKTEDINYEYSKLNWFPSFNLSRNFNQKHDLGLAFSNRINRPNEYWLNPFPEFEDEYFFSEGNPNLTPELIRNLELNYRYIAEKFTISSNVFYRTTHDKMDQLMVEDEATGKLRLSFHNNAQDRSTGLELVGNFNLLPWWSLNANGSAFHYQITGNVANEDISKNSVSWTAQMVNTFIIRQNTSIQAIGYYKSKTQNLQYDMSSFYFVDLALNHKFLDGKLSVGLQAKDILKTKNYTLITQAQNTQLTGNMLNESPVFMINVSYMVNQLKKQTKDVHTEFDM